MFFLLKISNAFAYFVVSVHEPDFAIIQYKYLNRLKLRPNYALLFPATWKINFYTRKFLSTRYTQR